MRISIILLLMSFTTLLFAAPEDATIKELFAKYEKVVDAHQVELVDEVFTKNFLEGNGGKEEFIKKVKSEPKTKEKSIQPSKITWKKGVMNEMYFAKVPAPASADKKAKEEAATSEFILVKENGKLKIDGTLSDAE